MGMGNYTSGPQFCRPCFHFPAFHFGVQLHGHVSSGVSTPTVQQLPVEAWEAEVLRGEVASARQRLQEVEAAASSHLYGEWRRRFKGEGRAARGGGGLIGAAGG